MKEKDINKVVSQEQPKKENKSRTRKKLILVLLVAYLIFILCAAAIYDGRHVRFYLSGAEEITLEYGETYEEPGVYAVATGKLFGESEKHLKVNSSGDLDISKLGSYTITYSARYAFQEYTATRKVTVQDTTPPEINLMHTDGYQSSWYGGYQEEGFTATDNHDGDLTAQVKSSEQPGMMVYTVSDSSGNEARAERQLTGTSIPPEIKLAGNAEMSFPATTNFSDPGFSVVDSEGNDLSQYVTVTGEVLPYRAGTYELVYSITNLRGETVSATRTVTVTPINNPDVIDPDGKTIYLTFDDGPGPYTAQLLDVLKKYNARVTFFVTAANEKYYDQIGRAYSEGHSIGVHTYSHNYKSIYSGEDAFFNDFFSMEEIIKEQTGSYTNLYRFPGGSSNTVSSFNPGIVSRLASDLTDMGYSYFDWNVSSGDAGETTKTDKVIKNIIDGCGQRKVSIVLQHDIKDYSVAAVEQVILWGLNNGYTFRALNQTSPTAHHSIAN